MVHWALAAVMPPDLCALHRYVGGQFVRQTLAPSLDSYLVLKVPQMDKEGITLCHAEGVLSLVNHVPHTLVGDLSVGSGLSAAAWALQWPISGGVGASQHRDGGWYFAHAPESTVHSALSKLTDGVQTAAGKAIALSARTSWEVRLDAWALHLPNPTSNSQPGARFERLGAQLVARLEKMSADGREQYLRGLGLQQARSFFTLARQRPNATAGRYELCASRTKAHAKSDPVPAEKSKLAQRVEQNPGWKPDYPLVFGDYRDAQGNQRCYADLDQGLPRALTPLPSPLTPQLQP